MTKQVLIATDFSAAADIAQQHGLAIANRVGADATLLHVVVPPELWDSIIGAIELGLDSNKVLAASVDGARTRLAKMTSVANTDELVITGLVEQGHPDSVIADMAKQLATSLVVVGTHGHSATTAPRLGSVAERVVRSCECDVLVARPATGSSSTATASGYHHILVPTDFSARAELALTAAVAMVSTNGVIDVAHWWQESFAATGYSTTDDATAKYRRQVAQTVADQGEALIAKFQDRHEKINFVSHTGATPHAILEHLESRAYDLVAIGSHGRRGIRRFILGSVAETVVRHAPCSVLVVHQ